MIEVRIEEETRDKIRRAIRDLGRLEPALEGATRDVSKTIRNLVLGRTPVGENVKAGKKIVHRRGTLKRGWSQVQGAGLSFSFDNQVDYADILEYGRYHGVGPRTVAFEGGIYSRQAVGGMMRPVLDDDEAIDKAAEFITEQILKVIGNAGA